CSNIIKSDKNKINSIRLPYLDNIIELGNDALDFAFNFNEFITKHQDFTDDDLSSLKNQLHNDAVIITTYSSATTSFPKRTMFSHYNIVNNAKQIGKRMNLTHEDRLCIPVPFFHTFGCVLGILTAVTSGATMVIVEQFDAEKVLDAVS